MCGLLLCGLLHHSFSVDVETEQFRPKPWTIEEAITDLGRKLLYAKVEPLKTGDFEILIRKAMYDIKLRVSLDKMEDRDPLRAADIDHALNEARRTIARSYVDVQRRRAAIAADFQHAVQMAVNNVLDMVYQDKDEDFL